MALHRLTSFTLQVPNPRDVISYYEEFGLTDNGDGSLSTMDGGRQLYVEQAAPGAFRRISGFTVGCDDQDDLGRISANLRRLDVEHTIEGGKLVTADPGTGTEVVVAPEGRVRQEPFEPAEVNYPGNQQRVGARADGAVLAERVRPRKLGHIVLGTPDAEDSTTFFTEGIGFKVSDRVGFGAFMRCSQDHHNLLVMSAPMVYPHHTSWQVEDVDAVGRGAMDMLEADPGRHVWGLGRHYAGSNFFWYLKDPAGNFSEYYSDMDCIIDDSLWDPESVEGARGLFRWGPPPPPSMINPEDVAAHMAGAHSA
ncbi:2%2C3-dihydroxybiphenyl 1%2C2-dioxygenase [Mycobacterium tuberculosis]|nr:2%2C3-dihydroxybiphenyl 1%2C2-dioxygenase [Mycobacterium tuberculosis]